MDDNPISTHRFVKGVKRAAFSSANPSSVDISPSVPAMDQPVQAPVQVAQAKGTPRKKSKVAGVVLWVLLGLLLSGLSILSVQMYLQYKQAADKLATVAPGVLLEKDIQTITEKVRRHMLLPPEEPVLNSVIEVERLKGETFYANAQNGDVVLVFPRRAILYRPTTDQIIEVGFIRQVNQTATFENTPAGESTPSGTATVAGIATSSAKVLINNEE